MTMMTMNAPSAHYRAAPSSRNLDEMAAHYAGISAVAAEAMIEAHVAIAITEWRVDDATFWQRVKYRARMLRATARTRVARA